MGKTLSRTTKISRRETLRWRKTLRRKKTRKWRETLSQRKTRSRRKTISQRKRKSRRKKRSRRKTVCLLKTISRRRRISQRRIRSQWMLKNRRSQRTKQLWKDLRRLRQIKVAIRILSQTKQPPCHLMKQQLLLKLQPRLQLKDQTHSPWIHQRTKSLTKRHKV